jgi:hypothetical protein
MYIAELFDPAPEGYRNERDDHSTINLNDTRKTRITFAHLNKLRISHDVRKIEHEQKLKDVAKQYALAPEGGAAPAVGM